MDVPRTAAGVAGVSAVALGLLTVTGPTVPDENWGTRGAVVNALGLVTFAALAVAVELLPRFVALARAGRTGIRVTQVGLVLMSVESVASQVHGGNTLGPVFMLGLLLTMVGFLVSGVDGLRRPQGRWLALVPFLAMVVSVGAGDRGGFLVLGLVWCGFGLAGGAAVPRGGTASREPVRSTD